LGWRRTTTRAPVTGFPATTRRSRGQARRWHDVYQDDKKQRRGRANLGDAGSREPPANLPRGGSREPPTERPTSHGEPVQVQGFAPICMRRATMDDPHRTGRLEARRYRRAGAPPGRSRAEPNGSACLRVDRGRRPDQQGSCTRAPQGRRVRRGQQSRNWHGRAASVHARRRARSAPEQGPAKAATGGRAGRQGGAGGRVAVWDRRKEVRRAR
jgi:hypothetical protein